MASIIESIYKDSELQSEFLRAKITANPFDYKVSNRLFVVSKFREFEKYDIFLKDDRTEIKLLDLLKLNPDSDIPYLRINSNLHLEDFNISDKQDVVDKAALDACTFSDGVLVMYNNLIIRDDILSIDLPTPIHKSFLNYKKDRVIEGLETWFIKTTSKESLIPALLYLTTDYCGESLADIEDLEFTKEFIEVGNTPRVYLRFDPSATKDTLLSNYVIPGSHYGYDKTICGHSPYYNDMQKVSIGLTTAYLMELLYQLKDIADKYPAMIERLRHDPDCYLDYFYNVNVDTLVINPELEDCFVKDNTTRFENFKNYYSKVISALSSKLIANEFYDNYFKMPLFIESMAASAHAYAFQQLRIKHLILFYTLCKNKGLDIKSEFSRGIDSDCLGLPGLPAGGSLEDTPSNELLDLGMDTYSGDSVNNDDDVLNSPAKKYKADPVLDAVDLLKKDLHDSPYDFDVNYIKSTTNQQESYNNVANGIKMLTVNLSKQIKEIKVYNTGGKCGGQTSGKLDKKNLWKYRTDHNIFYNNNYKQKEMDLAFGIILDESGSMSGEGIRNGKIVMILLHEVLNSLGINHSIIGHTSHGDHQCVVNKYYQFKEENHFTLQKPYALSKIVSKSGNCDSGALYYMQSSMKSVQNKDKIVIIFSDGEPTECTELELKEQVRDMEKSGIHVIGVGIDFESIKEYYPDNANGKNLKEMIDIVVNILKRYVLEKKD